MSESGSLTLSIHNDPDFFREAIQFTAARTEFLPRLIEKDYFCSVLLNYFANTDGSLVFKGGTCLTKVHADFYRLSEDLDFVISTPDSTSRAGRSKLADPLKAAVRKLPTANQTDESAISKHLLNDWLSGTSGDFRRFTAEFAEIGELIRICELCVLCG